MWKRILFDIIGILIVFMFPWWVAFAYGLIGIILFPWYIEIVIFGALIDILYGGTARHWYTHIIHMVIFAVPLFIGEFIKTKISL